MKRYLCIYFFLMCLISACGSTPTKVALQPPATLPASTKTPTATQRSIPTATFTKTPKPTPTATTTPSPTVTPIVLPTKQVLMQFGIFGGDGDFPTDAYFGRGTPQWVLYTDGQLLVRKSDKIGDWFAETMLTVPQMCSLLSRTERTGFFNLPGDGSLDTNDPIYQFDSTAQYSDGAPVYVIQVNGPRRKRIDIYWDYVPYLIPEAKAAFNLFSKYVAPTKLAPYRAQYALLWIEKGKGELAYVTPTPTSQSWLTNVASLEFLYRKNVETSQYVPDGLKSRISQVLIQGDDVQSVLDFYDSHLTGKLFKTDNGEYYVIARPLLPHESPSTLSAYPHEAVEFDLPFKCSQ